MQGAVQYKVIVGAIDIGTNSVRLIIAEKKNSKWRDLVRTVEVTRLGEGVDKTHTITREAMERTLAVLSQYKEMMERYGAERQKVVSTSAMRDAKNSTEFIALVRERLGLDIEVISGEEEGRLTFSGAVCQDSLAPKGAIVLVVDVGGGSTEYIYGKDNEVFGVTSLNIGSVRLTEQFLKHDPPLKEELDNARDAILGASRPVFKALAEANPEVMIAVAGTATQLAAVLYEVEPYDPEKIHGSKVTFIQLESLINRIAAMPNEKRKTLKGMHPKRADVLIGGSLILEETLKSLHLSEMIISEKDILDGLIYSIAE